MASPKITKQGASFPEDPPGTPKLQPGEDVQAVRTERALAQERPGEQGDRFAGLNQPEQAEVELETYEGDGWTGDTLRAEASKRTLSTSGTKAELAARLREHDQAQQQG
jgi:hypothetical protein